VKISSEFANLIPEFVKALARFGEAA